MNAAPPLCLVRVLTRLLIAVIGQAFLVPSAHAQTQYLEPNAVHWAYSPYFGTGWYQVRDDRDVYVMRIAPEWSLREAEIFDDGQRKVGIDFKLMLTAGLDSFSFDDLPGAIDPENLASLTATPGIDITVPVSQRWSLRPHVYVGWGKLLGESNSAWSYWAGVKSRYTFSETRLDWALVNSVAYVGYTPSEGSAADFWLLMAGLEFDYPLGDRKAGGEQYFLSWHGMYTTFGDDLNLDFIVGVSDPITDQWELGFSVHKGESRFEMGWFRFDRLGLAYRFSSTGNLKGISLVFKSAFDR